MHTAETVLGDPPDGFGEGHDAFHADGSLKHASAGKRERSTDTEDQIEDGMEAPKQKRSRGRPRLDTRDETAAGVRSSP